MRLLAKLTVLVVFFAAGVAGAAGADDLLEPDKAFRLSARALDAATLEVRYRIADGYYMYRERFRFAAEPAGVRLGPPQFPPGEVHTDQFFGRTETYRKDLRILVPLDDAAGAERIRLKVTSQGCSDTGVCYVPQDQYAEIRLAATDASVPPEASSAPSMSARPPAAEPSPRFSIWASDAEIKAIFESASFWGVLATFFGFGILLAFTPCMLPMVPILSGIIAGEGRDISKLRALVLSLAYVAGMALTYALAGVAAAYSGAMLAAALQNPWVLTLFAAVFVWLALSMFGFHDIQMPAFVRHRLSHAHHRLQGGRIASVTLMGVLSALIMSPCVAAPFAGALLYIGQTRDVVLGGSSLFVMALGTGVPLVAVGVSEGALLPKSGAWMAGVKKFFGVLLLGVAIWILSPVIPEALAMLAWAALFVVSAVFLRAIDPLPHDASGYARLWKGLGLIALVAGIALLIGALSGSRDPLQPLARLRLSDSGSAPQTATPFVRIGSLAELETRLAGAGKPAMLDFYADWCVSCKEMERFTFSDPRVRAIFADMLLLQADVTANTPEHKALLKRFRLFGPPGIIFFDRSGREIEGLRVIGYQNAERFLATLSQVQKLTDPLAATARFP
ncbi:MAG: protein-disulfide reductase DsbD [Betaproteobacteria bacterium]|nr:protein-disulfide reductase DsbD [Betaproteobacteria bacterium]